MTFQEGGIDFLPANPNELIGSYTGVSTLISCYSQCNINPFCRTFVSDISWPFTCRFYSGSIDTGTIIVSSSSTSKVGGLRYDASLYTTYNQICNSNSSLMDRYLTCINRTSRCPLGTYWNGSMCLNQVYYRDSCNINEGCRQDIGLRCSSSCNKCLCDSTTIWNGTFCVQSTCPSLLPNDQSLVAFLTLDNDASDLMNRYNGSLVGNPSFVNGYVGQAIQISVNNYVQLPHIDFYQRSFTIELWFNLINDTNISMALFSQCINNSLDQCLHFGITPNKILYMSFGFDEKRGNSILNGSLWYHVAFVYDYYRRQRLIYLNGRLDNTNIFDIKAVSLCLNESSITTIGSIPFLNNYFNGSIDHVSITYRVKTAAEILNDASLMAYYSFDCGSTLDSGPNLLHANANKQITVIGRTNHALLFNSTNAYFQAFGLTNFKSKTQSYSISFWIKPLSLSGTLIHFSTQSNGTGLCSSILGFFIPTAVMALGSSSMYAAGYNFTVNVWTHIVQTFSLTNGIRLYLNRTLYKSLTTTVSNIPESPVYFTLANKLSGPSTCHTPYIFNPSFAGTIDEVRIYNREITASEVCMLYS